MRLRHKLLGLFTVFAVAPLLAIGALSYARSLRAVDTLIQAQTGVIVDRIALALRNLLELQESDIALLGGNEETQRALRVIADQDSARLPSAMSALNRYADELWRSLRYGYERVVLRDAAGRVVLDLEDAQPGEAAVRLVTITRPVLDGATGVHIGDLELEPRFNELIRGPAMAAKFGLGGRNFVVDRRLGRVLVSSEGSLAGARDDASPVPIPRFAGEKGALVYENGSERRVGSYVNFEPLAWTVFATASVDEFADPFLRQRLLDLGLLVGIVVLVSIGFVLLLRRSTRSLDDLTAAAVRVGQGDLSPALPPAANDEVGQLSAAFRVMTDRIREMLLQVDAGRQMAVLGRFAAELSHEIRNPLTAIKLNLQGLEREGSEGRLSPHGRAAVEMALREIRRLDQALRTALRTGRPAAAPRRYGVHAVLEEAVTLLRPEAATQHTEIQSIHAAGRDGATGDPQAVKGALVNILLNAIQAMSPRGGTVMTATRNVTMDGAAEGIEVRIRDEGPGIPEDLRDRVFRPFFTTKDGGTGLGLSVALHTVQSQGGSLRLEEPASGAEVVITLPLDAGGVPE